MLLALTVWSFPEPLYSQNPEGAAVHFSILVQVLERRIQQLAGQAADLRGRARDVLKKSEPRFFVLKILLEGNQHISGQDLGGLLHAYENRAITVTDLRKLASGITLRYRKKGFVTSFAYLPPQKVQDGAVRIRIVEGKTGDFHVTGSRYFRKKKILSYLDMKKGQVLRYEDLRRNLVRLNQNPDRTVRAVLSQGKELGTTDVLLNVEDRLPLHAGFTYDNQGNERSGKERFGFTIRHNNFSGGDDILLGGFIFGKDFGAVLAQYGVPSPLFHSKFIGGFRHAQVSPKKDLKPFGVNGVSQAYFAKLERTLFDKYFAKVNFSGDLSLGLEFKESRTKVLSGTFSRERLRLFHIGSSFRELDRWGETLLGNEFSFGVNGFGARVYSASRSTHRAVEPDFFRYRLSLTRSQRMFWQTHSRLRMEYQYSPDSLPFQEAFSLGGASSVRGYPEGDYLADTAFLVNFEYFIPAFFFPADWQFLYSEIPLRNQIELVAFIDEGFGRMRDPLPHAARQRNLLGVGGGFRVKLLKDFFARTEWAYAAGSTLRTDFARSQFHFRLQWEI
jgi:hemolysin activation/secretion protein